LKLLSDRHIHKQLLQYDGADAHVISHTNMKRYITR